MKLSPPRVALLAALAVASSAPALSQSLIYNLPGAAAGDGFGQASRAAGDVDGDGVCDLILGSRAGFVGVGYARLVSGTNGMLIHEFDGAAAGDGFGSAVAALDDVNGDGVRDLIVGAPLAGAGSRGEVTVFSGLDGAPLRTLSGDAAGDHFGWSVVGLADVDGDTFGDFAVGALDADDQGLSAGTVRVFSGATGATLRTLQATAPKQLFGYALAAMPDLDGDTVEELIVGAPGLVQLGSPDPGGVRVFSGATGLELASWSGHTANDAFGRAVACAGDVDADGVPDVIVGAPQPVAGNPGYARVFSGATGNLLYDWAGDSAGDLFGAAVAAAGDVNLDTQGDVAVGAPGDDDNGSKSGSVRLLSGQAGSTLYTIHGEGFAYELGSSLDGGSDINADGPADLVMAVPGDVSAGGATGAARVLSPRTLALCADSHLLAVKASAPIDLHIDAGPTFAGATYELVGSISGTEPGTTYAGLPLELNPGRYFKFTLAFNPIGPLRPPVGVLDAQGRATATFAPPRLASAKWLVGRTFHHALVIYDAAGNALSTSNAWPVTITP